MRTLPQSLRLPFLLVTFVLLSGAVSLAQSPGAAMLRLLKSGRIPQDRLPTIVKLICDRGNGEDLQYIYEEVLKDQHWPDALRADTLHSLATATLERKTIPTGDLSGIAHLVQSSQPAIQRNAVELAGLWKVKAAESQLLKIAKDTSASNSLRRDALASLVSLDPRKAAELLKSLTGKEHPFALRALAISVLAPLNAKEASQLAVQLLQQAGPLDDPTSLLTSFLDLNNGSNAFAAALKETPPSRDVAKLLLRQMYSLGRTDEELNGVLSQQAGINRNAPPPTKPEMEALAAEAVKMGDPQRGEMIFRRKDLSCMNCHSVSKAGGQIGPDLSAIGASSPPEYLVASVLDPDQAIKEAYISRTVITMDGKILQGIIEDRTKDALVLKDATGKKISIPLADVDEEFAGKSLMPKGLINFMTHQEFLDLISFLNQLGKPGEFAIRTTQRMQRYRVLMQAAPALLEQVPTLSSYEDLVLLSENWAPAYAKVNGELPLAPLAQETGSDVLYLRGDVQCSESGAVTIQLNSIEGVTIWLDDQQLDAKVETPAQLSSGTHAIVLRIDLKQRSVPTLKMELNRPADSAAEFVVVDGK